MEANSTYYNLLVQGYRSGQLNLKREAPAGLARLANPYDKEANAPYRWKFGYPLQDLSYYKGSLYLYFGPTPALLVSWPYLAVTGYFMLHQDAAVILFSLGFLIGVGLLWGIWQRYFSEVRFEVVLAGAFALGLANFTPAILPRSDVFEVAISCGYTLTMLTMGAIWHAFHDLRRRSWWLAAASLGFGLAIGARPSLLLGAIVLLVPLLQAWRNRQKMWVLLLAAAGPIVLFGVGLGLYNHLRFDDPLEFGQRYQLPASWHQQFSLRYLWFNFRVCFLEPACLCDRFPFVRDIIVPPLPIGSGGVNHPFGVLSSIPVVWLGLAAPLAWSGRLAKERCSLRWVMVVAALMFGACALTLALHDSMCLRYEVEFTGTLVLLAVVGIFVLERALACRPAWRLAARGIWGLLLTCSITFNLFASLVHQAAAEGVYGHALLERGRPTEAIAHFRKAMESRPDFAADVATLLFQRNKVSEAVELLESALQSNPNDADAHSNLGFALSQQGKMVEAIDHYQAAIRLKPDIPETHINLGNLLFLRGQVTEAVVHFQEALKIRPDEAEAHNNLGYALQRMGQVDSAITHYQKALEIRPDYAEALNNLAWVLATWAKEEVRNGKRAVELAERANDLVEGRNSKLLDTLAAAYAEAARFAEAVRTAQAAMELAQKGGQSDLARQIGERLKLYQAGRPYHQE